MDSLCMFKGAGVPGMGPGDAGAGAGAGTESRPAAAHVSSLGRRAPASGVSVGVAADQAGSLNYLARPLRFLWSSPVVGGFPKEEGGVEVEVEDEDEEGVEVEVEVEVEDEDEEGGEADLEERRGNWLLKILHVRSIWSDKKSGEGCNGLPSNEEDVRPMEEPAKDTRSCSECCGEGEVGSCEVGADGRRVDFDTSTFSKFLKKVSLAEARIYAQMSYLGNLAYAINKIKPANLLKNHGIRFVTSSLERKKLKGVSPDDNVKSNLAKSEKKQPENDEIAETDARAEIEKQRRFGYQISASAAYQIAAAAASYVQSQTKNILPFASPKVQHKNDWEGTSENDMVSANVTSSKEASFVVTTKSVTAVVAAEEKMKQAVAKDLNSVNSSPCDWFICDAENTETRLFVIQGSETLASWQANLLFEPIKFERLDVLVHRGIYEAAKGMYKQMLPEVQAHLKRHGKAARLRFTGHSLGGSLALLVNLMLLLRGDAPRSSLLPVVTFGSPSIMCGGDGLLKKLGLPRSHVQAITMHRDIVPRAFSCHYPDHVAELLKAVNGNFRNHPCLKYQKTLYAPMGELLILQPDQKFSPEHHFLPSGTGFYRVRGGLGSDSADISAGELRTAMMAFLNSPHPLEILSDRSAYGSEGTVCRDHHVNSYLRSVRFIIREELNRVRKAKKEQRRKLWWPLIVSLTGTDVGVIYAPRPASAGSAARRNRLNFAGIVQNGRQSLLHISRFVTSRHLYLLLVLVIPARLLLLNTLALVNSH